VREEDEMGRLAGRSVIITGAGAGIGRGIARRFAREGARITLAELDPESGARTAREVEELGGEALFVQTDVGERECVEEAVRRAVERFGGVDVLVNNAWSGSALARVEWMEDGDLRRAFEVGALGCFWAMQACHPHMRARGYGRIVSMASLNGVNAHMYSVHYNMAKEALRALTRTAAREWADRGITCNVLCPAAETETTTALRRSAPGLFEKIDAALPMGRLGDPEQDIAPVALFLASEESRFVTGNTIFVDGGSHINGATWVPELPEEKPRP
jgi:NAD(P)-dependent dehydrogenase (short-subunit alcohol dehydrogenase family)